MRRLASALLLFVLALPVAGQVTPGPGLFGDRRFRAPVANTGALPVSAQLGEVRLALDVPPALYAWDGDSWALLSGGGGGGEANTASNLGGGLANFSAKVGVDLRFNSFAAVDFDLAANLLTVDASIARDSEIPSSLPPSGAAGGALGGTYPNPSVDDDGHAHTGATLPAASTTGAGVVELATSGEATAGLAVQGNDARLSDARAPTAHATSHQNNGSDEVSVAGLSGLLADSQTPLAHKASHEDGGADEISAAALSGQLADAQKVTVRKNSGADVGTRSRLNLIEGSGVTLTVSDDGAGGEVDITVAASGGGGSGDVVGPASATDNAAARFDGTTGKLLQNGTLLLPDSGGMITGSVTGSGQYGVRITTVDGGGAVAFSVEDDAHGVTTSVDAGGVWSFTRPILITEGGTTKIKFAPLGGDAGIRLASDMPFKWSSTTSATGGADTALSRTAAGALKIQDFIELTPIATAPTCDSGTAGRLYHDTSPALCWCNGTSWVVVSGTSCS